MPSAKYTIPLEPEKHYHIYNKGINGCKIFYKLDNYHYFIKKLKEYLNDYIEFYAYCLLPNHFHFLIRVKDLTRDATSLRDGILKVTNKDAIAQSDNISISKIASEQFRKFFISYSQAINKQENRSGNLFIRHFKRIHVNSDKYLKDLVFYIHYNPVKHNFFNDYKNYAFSSYNSILSDKPTDLNRVELLEWFDGKENYIEFHKYKHDLKRDFWLEDAE